LQDNRRGAVVPYQQHTRVRCNGIFGTLSGPVEIFSYGFALDATNFAVPATTDGLVAAIVALHSGDRAAIATQMILTEVAFSNVSGAGVQIGETLRVPLEVPGGGGSMAHPPQVAWRVSLGSGLRGKSQRGGFYLPGPTVSTGAETGLVTEQKATNCATAVVEMINQINAVGDPGGRVVIASSVAGNVPVNQVRVGRALDTIRTRRNALVEGYITPQLVVAA
jgi:hypothetical protein